MVTLVTICAQKDMSLVFFGCKARLFYTKKIEVKSVSNQQFLSASAAASSVDHGSLPPEFEVCSIS